MSINDEYNHLFTAKKNVKKPELEPNVEKLSEEVGIVLKPKRAPRSWQPGSRIPSFTPPKGYRARWVRNDTGNISKKLQEGWEVYNATNNPSVALSHTGDRLEAGTQGTSELRINELVAMVIPEDVAVLRDEHYESLRKDQMRATVRGRDARERLAGTAASGALNEGVLTIN